MLTDKEWEELCDGCGKCCGLTWPKEGEGIACPGLDVAKNVCTVYERRLRTHICLKVEPDNVEEFHQRGILPDSCAYVRHVQGQEPLDEPVVAKLIPFALASKKLQRRYYRANRKWQKECALKKRAA